MNARRELAKLHEQRVAVHREWDAAFRQFLLDEQSKVFGVAVATATTQLQRVGAEVAALVKGCDDATVRELVVTLERWERKHLEGKVLLQSLQATHFVDDARRLRTEEELERADRRGGVIEHEHAHHRAVEVLGDKVVPFDEVYNQRAAAAAREVAQAVEAINEVIEELREDLY